MPMGNERAVLYRKWLSRTLVIKSTLTEPFYFVKPRAFLGKSVPEAITQDIFPMGL